ncbi:MAG: hypothetical protein LBS19_11985, partial [Clostridiales bacterium]|nr:hypothetical protein [Clostridiales bacterium]
MPPVVATLRPVAGAYRESSWREVTIGYNDIYDLGSKGGFMRIAAPVFSVPDLRYAKIIEIKLTVRLENQFTLQGTGRLYTGGMAYSGASQLRELQEY